MRYDAPGNWYLVPGVRYQVRGTRYHVKCMRDKVRGVTYGAEIVQQLPFTLPCFEDTDGCFIVVSCQISPADSSAQET